MTLIERLQSGGIVRAFRHRDFAIYQLSSWFSDIGMWLMRIGMGWLTWELTHSGAWLGGIVMAQSLPSVFLVPFAGALADRLDRVKILRWTQCVSICLASGLAAMTWAGLVNEYALLGYAVLHGAVGTLAVPARVTIGPNLVPRADISAAIAVGSVIFGSSTFLGPALAGLLIVQAGIEWTFAGNALGNLILVIALGMVRLTRQERHVSERSILGDVVDGVRYVVRHQGILTTLVLATCSAMLVRPLSDLMPGFADTVFLRGAEALAILMAAMGAGGMIGSTWLANRNKLVGTSAIFLWGSLVFALGTAAFALTSNFFVAIVCMTVIGGAMSVANNSSQILIQNAVAGSMRARVMSLYSYNYRTMPALGALAMGAAANWIGFQPPVVAGALACVAAWLWAWRRRQLMRDSLETMSEDAAPPLRKAAE
jgi:MFS family permease